MMPSEFDSLWEDVANPQLFEFFGDSDAVILYSEPSNRAQLDSIKLCNVWLGDERTTEEEAGDGRRHVVLRDISLNTKPSSKHYSGHSRYLRGAQIEIDGVAYAIESLTDPTQRGFVDIVLRRAASVERSRRDFRRR